MNILKLLWHQLIARQTDLFPVRAEALVVEDESDEADLLSGLLRMQNVVVTQAFNIAAALNCMENQTRFHLAFVDLGLPDGSGVEVVRRIKQSRRMTHVVVVSGQIEKIQPALEHGYIGVLGKPYSINSIREVLWKHRLPLSD